MEDVLQNANKIVIKIGSSLLLESSGNVRADWLYKLIDDVTCLQKQNKQVIIVTSGAIGLGRRIMGFAKDRKLSLGEKQAAAATGQIELMKSYQLGFNKYGQNIAQLLLTIEDSENRKRYLNACNTLDNLLKNKIIPIINENDAVATTEIKFGDNDRLAARVAQMARADLLILLSDVDGLYTSNPQIDKDAKLIPYIKEITGEILEIATGPVSAVGTGGMKSKIMAAIIANNAGCSMVITSGIETNPIAKLYSGTKNASLFIAAENKQNARKKWLATSLYAKGKITINQNAKKALLQGSSLLPVGVVSVTGNFDRDDIVHVLDEEGSLIAKGITSYSKLEANKIKGCKSTQIADILGEYITDELIHRDNLVIVE